MACLVVARSAMDSPNEEEELRSFLIERTGMNGVSVHSRYQEDIHRTSTGSRELLPSEEGRQYGLTMRTNSNYEVVKESREA